MRDVQDVIVAIYQLGVEEASDAELREVIGWLQCELDNRADRALAAGPDAEGRDGA